MTPVTPGNSSCNLHTDPVSLSSRLDSAMTPMPVGDEPLTSHPREGLRIVTAIPPLEDVYAESDTEVPPPTHRHFLRSPTEFADSTRRQTRGVHWGQVCATSSDDNQHETPPFPNDADQALTLHPPMLEIRGKHQHDRTSYVSPHAFPSRPRTMATDPGRSRQQSAPSYVPWYDIRSDPQGQKYQAYSIEGGLDRVGGIYNSSIAKTDYRRISADDFDIVSPTPTTSRTQHRDPIPFILPTPSPIIPSTIQSITNTSHHYSRTAPLHGQSNDRHQRRFPSRSFSPGTPAYIQGRNEGFSVVDPFMPSMAYSMGHIAPAQDAGNFKREFGLSPHLVSPQQHSIGADLEAEAKHSASEYVFAFFTDTLPRQIYLHFLLRLPSLYFSRVTRIFKDAELSIPDIQQMAVKAAGQTMGLTRNPHNWDLFVSDPSSSRAFQALKSSWESFIDSLMREWKTTNIVSILLLSAILTTLQIPEASAEPITRESAIMALICALMSLLYGCMYIIRFGIMRKTHKAAAWAEESQQSKTLIWWNVWVFLAMPAIWLSWSIILYLVCIVSFVWRTGSDRDPMIELSPTAALGPRIATMAIFALGILYFVSIVRTLSRYGDAMDQTWRRKMDAWAEHPEELKKPVQVHPMPDYPVESQHHHFEASNVYPVVLNGATPTVSRHVSPMTPGIPVPALDTFKVMDLHFGPCQTKHIPQDLLRRGVKTSDWAKFIADVSLVWNGQYPDCPVNKPSHSVYSTTTIWTRPQDVVSRFLEWWNTQFFYPLHLQVLLCQEYLPEYPESSIFTVYMRDFMHPLLQHNQFFTSPPTGLCKIHILEPATSAVSLATGLRRNSYYSGGSPPLKPPPFPTTKVVDLRFQGSTPHTMPKTLLDRDIRDDSWDKLCKAASEAWDDPSSVRNGRPGPFIRPQDAINSLILKRNTQHFRPRASELVLCEEYLADHPHSPTFAIYLMDLTASHDDLAGCFGQVPEGMKRIDIYDAQAPDTGKTSLHSEESIQNARILLEMGMES